jgi:hypothetical protein
VPTETNPYAPPREGRKRRKRRRGAERAPGEWVKWAYAVTAAVSAVTFFFIALGLAPAYHPELIRLVDGPLSWAMLLLGVFWVYFAWSGLPRRLSGGVTPGTAVVRFIIPIYSLYWVFGVNLQLCNGLDAALAEQEDARRAPKVIAMGATVLHFVPVVMLFTEAKAYAFLVMIASSGLWCAYMWLCDPLRSAVWSARNRPTAAERRLQLDADV